MSLVTKTSKKGISLFVLSITFSLSSVNLIFGCLLFKTLSSSSDFEMSSKDKIISSTNLSQQTTPYSLISFMYFSSKYIIKNSAKSGPSGKPIATPSI